MSYKSSQNANLIVSRNKVEGAKIQKRITTCAATYCSMVVMAVWMDLFNFSKI